MLLPERLLLPVERNEVDDGSVLLALLIDGEHKCDGTEFNADPSKLFG